MKKNLFLVAMALLPVAGFVACDDDDNENNNVAPSNVEKMEIVSTGASDCLGSPYDLAGKGDENKFAYCDYVYNAKNGTIKLVINNIIRNCAFVPTLSANNYYSKNIEVTISEPSKDDSTLVRCECLYSDTIVMRGLSGVHTLTIKDGSKYRAKAEIDFSSETDIENRVYIDEEIPSIHLVAH